ncbi:MAG: hypothetical protein IJ626_04055 [Muribaculaceae bacterium]|nr:hypothetical protein [Muribaculaceae bacterium]
MKNRRLFTTIATGGKDSRTERNEAVLRAAHRAWAAGATLRASRARNKRFTYGDQWGDLTTNDEGKLMTEWERFSEIGEPPITNNLIRQLVKTVVGRFRTELKAAAADRTETCKVNYLNELDSRNLEEFLISGCCVQRVDEDVDIRGQRQVTVTNVNMNRFFVNSLSDPLARDCEIVGQLHDLSIAELLRRTAGNNRRRAEWIRSLYSVNADIRTADCATRLGADDESSTDFWRASGTKCRAIEVWTLESHEVMVTRNNATGEHRVEAVTGGNTRHRSNPDTETYWDVVTTWHCRWFSPMGDLLTEYESPFGHGEHPFVMKFYPLTDGEVHSMVEDVIDQQKYVNRLITLVNHILSASAKGVLLFPENAIPDGFTWDDVRRVWSQCRGILPYATLTSGEKPSQISLNNTDIGAFEMIQLQLKMLEDVSGVNGALMGRGLNAGNSAALYRSEVENATAALADVYETFATFRRERDRKMESIRGTSRSNWSESRSPRCGAAVPQRAA